MIAQENDRAATVAMEIPPGTKVIADEEYLTRALANLVRNAIRYASTSGRQWRLLSESPGCAAPSAGVDSSATRLHTRCGTRYGAICGHGSGLAGRYIATIML